MGLHFIFIYVSYNEILLVLYSLYIFVQHHLGLNCERLHMAGLDDCNILQPRHLVGNGLGGTHDSISVQNLTLYSFTCMSSQAMSDQRALSLM
jgi:hypothetical protein